MQYQEGRVVCAETDEVARRFLADMEWARHRRARWPYSTSDAVTVLGKLFPSLWKADGIDPWDADKLIAWLNGPEPTSGSAWAGRFLLGV